MHCLGVKISINIALLSILFSCSQKHVAEPSFYFWRTTANLSPIEKQALDQHHVKTVYVRLFDVDAETDRDPSPLAVIDSIDDIPELVEIIPVVFITNRTFMKSSDKEAISLADNILRKVNSILPTYTEIQIDCDWSEGTRNNYFAFLKQLKTQLGTQIILSTTIRLHQVKYPQKTGVPPADRGMLMFYNMGKIADANETNSIFDKKTAQRYTASIGTYELPLDVALPIFRWYVHLRNGKVQGLISKKQFPDINNSRYFSPVKNNTIFKVKEDWLEQGVYYQKNDVLRLEVLDDATLMEAAEMLLKELPAGHRRVVLYDLDEININNYEAKTLENVFSVFN